MLTRSSPFHAVTRLTLLGPLVALALAACGPAEATQAEPGTIVRTPDGGAPAPDAGGPVAMPDAGVPVEVPDAGVPDAGTPPVSSAPSLGSAAQFAVLGASTVTCTNASAVSGDVGVSPGTALTGFSPDCTVTGAVHASDAVAVQAHADLGTAFGALAAVACTHPLTGQDLGGLTLAPGVYCFDTTAGLTGQLTLDGAGDPHAVWIFQVGSALTTGTGAAVVMAGSGQPCNVFWRVGSSATIGTGTALQGNLLASASIALVSGSSVVGRALAVNAAVTLDHNTVTLASCAP